MPPIPELPRALAPWADYLDIFPPEIASALGPLIQRLDAAIGPLRTHTESGTGEPDGYDGLSRRGLYERLLLSDWLLAEEAPDEFIRRAAMGEHGFLRLARREPVTGTESWALFDTGPTQLGTPRLVHLAALVVLARRANAGRALFRWTAAQGLAMPFEGVYAQAVRSLLAARTGRDALEPNLGQACRTAIEGASKASWDLWAVGGAALVAIAEEKGFSSLFIRDLVEPGSRQLAVTVRQRGRPEHDLLLDLPGDPMCARILRDPFEQSASAPRRTDFKPAPASDLVWSTNGTKLFARARADSVLSYPVPNSPKAPAGRVRQIKNAWGLPVAALGRWGRRTIAAGPTADGSSMWITCIDGKCGGFGGREYALLQQVQPPTVADGSPLLPCLPARGTPYEALILIDGNLMGAARREGSSNVLGIVDRDVAAVGTCANGMAYVAKRTSLWFLISLGSDGQQRTHRQFDQAGRVFFGFGGPHGHQRWGLAAVEGADGAWTVAGDLGNEPAMTIDAAPGERVVGVVGWEGGGGPALVVVVGGGLADGKTLAVRQRSGLTVLDIASTPIKQVAVSPANADIAYTTASGEVVVYSLRHRGPLLRLLPEGGEP